MKSFLLLVLYVIFSHANSSFTPLPDYLPKDSNKVALGKALFFDPQLSSDKSISCASCHQFSKGGADGREIAIGTKQRKGQFNTPTIFNSSLNTTQGWTGSDTTVHQRAKRAFIGSTEMNGNIGNTLAYLKKNPAYQKSFKKSYPYITEEALFDAIEAYISTLLTPSPFDAYLKGDKKALTPSAKRGFKLFQEKGCVSCHNGVNIGGSMHQKLGIFNTESLNRGNNLGRYALTKREKDKYVFKVPSLRNVALTAPYLHDGRGKTLKDVIKIVATYQLGEEFKEDEINDLISFLKSLSGRIPNEQ